ncbi:MAG: hypothetical protein N2515_09595, partial [Deltaproteobacteria bacterium]|nr:hypothetical protein [Deltaproteobacteria bacterium]
EVQGHADLALAKHLMEAFDRVAADWSPVESFHDWQGVQSYDSEARDAYIQWAQGHRPKVLRVHILTGSKLVAMAVAVAKLKLDYLEPYTDQKAFEERKFEAIWRRLRELR